MKLKDLLEHIENKSVPHNLPTDIEVIPVTNPAECEKNTLLIITKKVNRNATIEVPHLTTLPYAILTDADLDIEVPTIRTSDARYALSFAYKLHYLPDGVKMRVVGITGTNGKTTTATLIYKILMKSGIKAGLIGTGSIMSGDEIISPHNYTMTTPDPSVLYKSLCYMQNDGCEVVIMEVSSHSLALHKVDAIDFDIGVFTNLSSEHMDFHLGMDDYFQTKMLLFRKCKSSIFNIDDPYGKAAYSTHRGQKEGVGIVERGDIFATDINMMGLDGSEFLYRRTDLIFKAKLQLPGPYNIYNALLALSVVIRLGVKPCIAKEALAGIEGVSGRLEIVHKAPTIIIDYAHTPDAMENLLNNLKSMIIYGQKLYIVFGCGGDRDAAKRCEMGKSAIKYADKVIITEDNNRSEDFDNIANDIISEIRESDKYVIIPDRYVAIRQALSMATAKDVVAIIGKGHERYIIDKNGMRPFDERLIVQEYYGEAHEGKA